MAGVIGRKKFIYDLWGDAVNTASRMESHGSNGTIQITRATYELIKGDFVCEPRGTVYVKGKGEMEAWQIHGGSKTVNGEVKANARLGRTNGTGTLGEDFNFLLIDGD